MRFAGHEGRKAECDKKAFGNARTDKREVWLKSARLGNRLVATSASIRIA
jgi:hypothetical protein